MKKIQDRGVQENNFQFKLCKKYPKKSKRYNICGALLLFDYCIEEKVAKQWYGVGDRN
jgi:hypothetical protein